MYEYCPMHRWKLEDIKSVCMHASMYVYMLVYIHEFMHPFIYVCILELSTVCTWIIHGCGASGLYTSVYLDYPRLQGIMIIHECVLGLSAVAVHRDYTRVCTWVYPRLRCLRIIHECVRLSPVAVNLDYIRPYSSYLAWFWDTYMKSSSLCAETDFQITTHQSTNTGPGIAYLGTKHGGTRWNTSRRCCVDTPCQLKMDLQVNFKMEKNIYVYILYFQVRKMKCVSTSNFNWWKNEWYMYFKGLCCLLARE